MAKPRSTTVRRIEFYVGPDLHVSRDDLAKFDASGGWMCQPKIDGMFATNEVGVPANGVPNVLKSRDARTPEVTGSNAGDLLEQQLPFPLHTLLIGELEAASQWSKDQNTRLHVRRQHLFDVVRYGEHDWRDIPNLARYEKLVDMHAQLAKYPELLLRFPLVPMVLTGFQHAYDTWTGMGLEGVVIKLRSGTYRTHRSDGKTDQMHRCVAQLTDEFVLIGTAMTAGGKTSKPKPNGVWGLWDAQKGEWCEIFRGGMRTAAEFEGKVADYFLKPEYFGKLVVQFEGKQRFKSGALQHAQSMRIRHEKQSHECVVKS